jgi:hypothetical protein
LHFISALIHHLTHHSLQVFFCGCHKHPFLWQLQLLLQSTTTMFWYRPWLFRLLQEVYPHPQCSEDYRLPHLLQEVPVHPELVYSVLPELLVPQVLPVQVLPELPV